MKRVVTLGLLGTLALIPQTLAAEEAPERFICQAGTACIDEALTEAEKEGFTGTVLVAEGDRVVFQKGYGLTAREGGVPIDENTVYLIGSIVKDFTRMAIFALADRGKLSYSDTLDTFFPDAPADKKKITLRQILDHRSGIPDLIDADGSLLTDFTVDYDYTHFTRGQAVEKTLKAPLQFEPGTDELYSNSGFALLAAIIEIVSGKPYEAFVKEVVFDPAGMENTGYRLPDWSKLTLAHGIFDGRDWGTPLDGDRWMADGPSWNLRGNGGMLGTVPDLFKFIKALTTPGVYPEKIRQDLFGELPRSKNYRSRYYAGAGSNGIFNSVFFIMFDQDRTLIMISSTAEHNAELDYLREFLPYAFIKYEDN